MNKNVLKRILIYTKPFIKYIILAFVSALISVGCSLLAPVIIGKSIDLIIDKNNVDFSSLIIYLFILAGIISLGAFFQWILSNCTNKITYNTVKNMRIDVFNKINKLPLKYIDSNSHGDIISRVVTDVEQISDGLLQGFTQLFSGIVTILGTLIFMVSIDYKIALVVILLTPLSFFIANFISKHSFAMFKEQSKVRGELFGFSEEMIGNQKVVKAFSHEKENEKQFKEINDRLYKCGWKAQFFSSLTNPCTRFVNSVVYVGVGITGAIIAVNGEISVGLLSCFLAYANQYSKPFNEITGVITELQSAFASARRIFAIIDETEEINDKNLIEINNCDRTLKVDDVFFSYDKDIPLIENLNLDVKDGDRVAIVGPTGCGKTTIINLLMRFYDTDKGKIYVSGKEIKDVTRKSLRSCYGMVLQETWLFTGTVKENIAYGREDATDEEIFAAAKLANADSFIKKLEKGYITEITENGGDLSQGEKQLLCIARIMLIKPPMLILDEATSSIDTRTEMKIQKAFASIIKDRTSFIVAHRLSTIKDADTILVMDKGHIIEQGNHENLLRKNGFYAKLYNSQFEQS